MSVALNAIDHGTDGEAPPVLIAHGLFGSARNWGVIGKRLSDRGRVRAVDMRNHGQSPWTDTHSYPELAEDLAARIDGTWDVVGHSMGGKAAMAMALLHPDKVRRLVVADIAPVGYDHSQMQYVDAMQATDLSAIASRREVEAQLRDSVPEDGIRSFLLQSLDLQKKRWILNLDTLASEMDRITGWPEIEGRFEGPTLFLSGSDSDYVRREHRDRIGELFPHARFAKLQGAGHWLHAEKPRQFEASLRAFLDA